MTRKFFSLTIAFASLAAFFVAVTAPAGAQSLSANEKLYAELAKLPAKERQARLVAGAKKEGTIEMIHSLRRKLGRNHIKGFTKKYPFIKVKNSDMGSQDAAERVVAEETAGRHLTDTISIGVPDATILIAQNRVARYPTPATKRIFARYKGFIDPQNRWVPYYWSEYGMSYNTNLVKEADAPKQWFDLCKPKYKGKFSFDPPTTRFLVGLYVMMGEEKAKKFIACIGRNNPIIQRGHTARLKLMLRGDHWIQGANYFYRGTKMKNKNPKVPFKAVYTAPVLGYAGAIMINKNAPHPYAAALWADYTLSKTSQKVLRKAWRGTLAMKHAYFPEDAKLITYNYLSADIVNRLHDYWGKHVGRKVRKRKK
ncbi:MAG: extracellular solute-binding protein [Alphaproteobacteria bacterium]|nr:extracellular solute-binding protein [Alphaproteobacteria bacterium]